MPLVCPRCQSTNPEFAAFCYRDGVALRAGADAGNSRLIHDFVFPSGRRCRTFDELTRACQEEWEGARDLLRRGVFQQFFASCGRHDLARSAQEAMTQSDPNLALVSFVNALPGTAGLGPRLDLNPRRLQLGSIQAGEARHVEMAVNNNGQGVLHGTVAVSAGAHWLRLGGSGNGRGELHASREQRVQLHVDTRGLPAGQSYGGKLTIVTTGGVCEVPVRLELAAHPFPRAPLQGARTPRELAEKMRAKPKAAVPLLESGEIARWFASNGWNYPVQGTPVKGIAGVQQFFEALGLSKPPEVKPSQSEVRCECSLAATVRSQIALATSSRKWVYANVESDSPWLTVVTPQVSGPRTAEVVFEIDPRALPRGRSAEGALRLSANGGQILTVRVRAQAVGAAAAVVGTAASAAPVLASSAMGSAAAISLRPSLAKPVPVATPTEQSTTREARGNGIARAILAIALAFFLLRLLLAPLVDGWARPAAAASAAHKIGLTLDSYGDWLTLPWPALLLSGEGLPSEASAVAPGGQDPSRAFRDQFTSYFVFLVVMTTWWVGALGGGWLLARRGDAKSDPFWGLAAGAVAGVLATATFACLVLVGDLVPHLLWSAWFPGRGGVEGVPVWILLALFCWTILGGMVGTILTIFGSRGRTVLGTIQSGLSATLRRAGLTGMADYFAA